MIALLTSVEAVLGDKPAPAQLPAPRSIFVQPSNFNEGRDPFFPESSRSFESLPGAKKPVETTVLKSPGFSVVNGNRLAIINNHTFSVGDEGDVLTNGKRVKIRCLEIRNDLVIVLVNGQRREISFGAK
jgi:hypothetical protein